MEAIIDSTDEFHAENLAQEVTPRMRVEGALQHQSLGTRTGSCPEAAVSPTPPAVGNAQIAKADGGPRPVAQK